jgi:predicted nuclease of predicted toxin-antitoxin system
MIRFLTDEDFDGRIVRGLCRHYPEIDVLRIQDAALRTHHDRDILAGAAEMNRVLLSHDVRTMYTYAYERLSKSLAMPGVILVD